MRCKFVLLAIVGSLLACSQEPGIETPAVQAVETTLAQTESERLNDWFDVMFEEGLQMSPIRMTFLGRKDRYGEIDDFSEAGSSKRLAWLAGSVAELRREFVYENLDLETKTSYDLWIYRYEQAVLAHEFERNDYIFTQMQGIQSRLANILINFHKVDNEADMRAYNKRIGAVSNALQQLLARAKVNASVGVRPPEFAYKQVIVEATTLITGKPFDNSEIDSPLWIDVNMKIDGLLAAGDIGSDTADSLRSDAKTALLDQFQPSYQSLINWINIDSDNVTPIPRGVGHLPRGEAYYLFRLNAITTTDLSPAQIHEIGLSEVARIRAEMEQIKQRVGFEGSLLDFFQYQKEDPRFFYANTDEGREAYIADSEKYLAYIKSKLPEYFGLLPKADLIVRRVESFREQDGAAQHYFPGTPDGKRAGIYYAHLSDMNAMPKHLMEAVAYHEGNPGHHMQISIAQELTSVPKFRTLTRYTVYTEGWGLYAELLAKEIGAYQDDYSEFGRLTTEMWRAIRLVVDTGLHANDWTEEQANAYFKQNSPIADGAVKSEVRRYMVLPAQATAYKIGMLKILELREFARQKLGENFDIRAFHDVVLGGGALPMKILERRVQNWVDSRQRVRQNHSG